MMNMSNNQRIYSPLPQSISSDTESEEELHSTIPIQTKFIENNKHLNGEHRTYHHLNDFEDTHINGFPNLNPNMMDDAPMIKDGYRKPMSTTRKFFFCGSILLCLLIIFIFLWVLPCTEDATCSIHSPTNRISNWEKLYHDIELMGPINVVQGINGHKKNLVFLFRNDTINFNTVRGLQSLSAYAGGAISIIGDNGKVAWYVPRQRLPSDIDCSLLDVNKNGYTDCIMSGAEGMLEAIDPISGSVQWYLHSLDNDIITSVDFPLVIADIDNDNVNDLLTTCSLNKSNHNIIIIVSGQFGKVLYKPYLVKDCDHIHNLQLNKDYISYCCQNDTNVKRLPLQRFYNVIFKGTHKTVSLVNNERNRIRNTSQTMSYSVNGRELIVNNQGKCPGSCSVSVQLIDRRTNRAGSVLYSYIGKNVYGMVPTSITFKNTENNINSLQGHVNGFTLKYWQWNDSNNDNSNLNHSYYKLMKKLTNKRSLPLGATKNTTIFEQTLTERVSLITFNSTKFNVVNASQNEIKQLCVMHADRVSCQPDLFLQKNSVLIADLNNDGSKELISYLSTFLNSEDNDDENDTKYQLQSKVKVVQLESELPKLYVTKY